MAAHYGPLSLGFSRQEHWSGLPFPSPMHEGEKWKWSRSVMSNSSWPHGLQPTRLLRPWDFPGKSTGVGCHCLLWCNLWLLFIYFFLLVMLPSEIPKLPHRAAGERVSWCLETSLLLRLPSQDGYLSLPLLSLFSSLIFRPTSFQRQWAAFLGAWCPPLVFRNCSVVFAQHSNALLMNLWGRKWSPHPIPPPS